MSARRKLNAAFLTGGLLLAGLVGAATGSWAVAAGTLAAAVALDVYVGNIRPRGRSRQR